jgi:hypothetical protein
MKPLRSPNPALGNGLSQSLVVSFEGTIPEVKRGESISDIVKISECSELSEASVEGLPSLAGVLWLSGRDLPPEAVTPTYAILKLNVPERATPGKYPLTLTVADDKGRSGSARFDLTVTM